MPVPDPVINGDQVRHDRMQNLVSTASVVVEVINSAINGGRR